MKKPGCLLLLFILAGCRTEPAKIYQNTVSGRSYYHVLFKLTPMNSSFAVPPSYQDPNNRPEKASVFTADGMFEVFIHASDFPVQAPGCNGGWIILRMPSTDNASDADRRVEAKKALWDRLQKMYASRSGSVEIVIELNPYVHVIDAVAPRIELEYCNVFFRHAYGAYVPYVGPLRQDNTRIGCKCFARKFLR